MLLRVLSALFVGKLSDWYLWILHFYGLQLIVWLWFIFIDFLNTKRIPREIVLTSQFTKWDIKQTSMRNESKTNNIILHWDPLLSRTKYYCSSMFSYLSIKSILTNKRKTFCFKTSEIDLDLDHMILNINNKKKHIDTSIKERPQTLLVPSEEICRHVLCNKHN